MAERPSGHCWGCAVVAARILATFLARVSLVCATSIDRDYLIFIYASFAEWAHTGVILDLHPPVYAGPTVQMATHGDHRFSGQLIADVALECPAVIRLLWKGC